MDKEERKQVKPEKGDKILNLKCSVCGCEEFIPLFNISKLEKEGDENSYLSVKDTSKVKCSVCGKVIKIELK